MNDIEFVDTPLLRIAVRSGGSAHGLPVLLVHGWPDDASTYDAVAPQLQRAGLRTLAPWLRGCGPTRFRDDATPRSGEIVAMAQDMLDLADALGLHRFAIVGHDWGARIAYVLAALFPQRVAWCAALSVPWDPGPPRTPPLAQVRAFWYQWFMATARGAEVVRRQRKAIARIQWETWSPPGWFDDAVFDAVAQSFENPDWAEVTLHSYTVRWGEAQPDPRYAELARRQAEARSIGVPTLMIQGGADGVILPPSSEGKQGNFSGRYERLVLEGIGHFPTREAPAQVSEALLRFAGGCSG